jgi:hypothetical protein
MTVAGVLLEYIDEAGGDVQAARRKAVNQSDWDALDLDAWE